MRFICNLRDATIEAFEGVEFEAPGFLLSTHRISAARLAHAREISESGLPLFADNGIKELIEEVIDEFSEPATNLNHELRELRNKLGRTPRGAQVTSELRNESRRLSQAVIKRVIDLSDTIDGEHLLNQQLSMKPTAIIAQEDFAIACMIALGLERGFSAWPIERYDQCNKRSLKHWSWVNQHPSITSERVYAVMGAMDFNTARSAGRLAGEHGVENIAIGTAAINLNKHATDFFVLNKASYALNPPSATRYVRLAQIAAGITLGYREATGQAIPRIHYLGLGAPNLFAIPGACHDPDTEITVDSSAPIQVAIKSRILFDRERFGDRSSMKEIVERILAGKDWPFSDPFTQKFKQEFGHDGEKARTNWIEADQPEITNTFLETANSITKNLPLFADIDDGHLPQKRRTRVAYNHWSIIELLNDISAGDNLSILAKAQMKNIIDQDASTISTRGLTSALKIISVFDRLFTINE